MVCEVYLSDCLVALDCSFLWLKWLVIIVMIAFSLCTLHLIIHSQHFRGAEIMVLRVLVAQSCLTVCDPMDCSGLGSSVYGILQFPLRILDSLPDPGIKPRSPALQGDLHHLSHEGSTMVMSAIHQRARSS